MTPEELRVHVAYLLWQIDEGYLTPEDRAVVSENWMVEREGTRLLDDDREIRDALLLIADEVIAEVKAAISGT